MPAHWTTVAPLRAIVGFSVELLEVFQAARVVHVRAVEQRRLLIVDERIEANRAVSVASLTRLLFYALPELAQLLGCFALFIHRERALFLLVESPLHIGEERLQQLLRALNVLIDRLVEDARCSPLLLHQVVLLLVYQT